MLGILMGGVPSAGAKMARKSLKCAVFSIVGECSCS